jgi:putative ABC transport system permease protein
MALRVALRELRGGVRDFRIFLSCLIIGVAVIAAVTTVSRHIAQGIDQESRTLLGGDLELSTINQRASDAQMDFLRRYGRVSVTATMRSMVVHGEDVTLVELKGVDENYPLLGKAVMQGGATLAESLAKGGLVAEQAFFDRMQIAPGATVQLADAHVAMVDVLVKEPDRITSPLTLGPRVMAGMATLQRNGLLQPMGLVRYHYHILLDEGVSAQAFQAALAENFPHAPWIVKTLNDNNRGVQDFISRLQLFMTLAGLASLLIGGIGIMNAAETYLHKKSESIAVYKTLGASRNFVFGVYMLVLLLISFPASCVGAFLGSVLSTLALPYLAQFLPVFSTHFSLDAPAMALAVVFGVLTVFTFSIAALGRGVEVRPAVLFRGIEPGKNRLTRGKLALNMACALLLVGTLIVSASDVKIAIGFIVCALASFLIFYGATALTQAAARRVHLSRPWARMALANLYRPGAHTLSIMLSTGIGLTVLISLLLVEGNFQKEVKETMPAIAPSLFLIDIQPNQKDAFLAMLAANPNVSDVSSQPMIRGRIARINGVEVEKIRIDSDSKWAVESDRGLTYSAVAPDNSKVAEGAWWDANYRGKPLVSLDRKLAKGIGIGIGDTITVNVQGREITAEIRNLRDINYISFQINFALIFSPGVIEDIPATFIATARVTGDKNEAALIRQIAKMYTNVSAVRIKDSIDQITQMVGHIAFALRLSALVTLVSGVLVLASALAATLDARAYDMVVLKVLGARKADILKMFMAEWLLLAGLTSLIACVLGMGGAWLILKRLDWVQFHVLPVPIVVTVGLALAFVTLTGFVIHTRIFNTRASSVLRNE